MANQFYTQAFQVLQSLGQVKPGDNVRIQEHTAYDTYVIGVNTALSNQQFFNAGQTKNYPYRNITFPDTSRSYVYQRVNINHDFQFTVHAAGAQNWQLYSFNQFSTIQWVINGVQTPPLWQSDLMYTQFGTWFNDSLGTPVQQLQLQPKFQTWYELADPINLGAGVNATFNYFPQSGLTTINSAATASTPYAPNTGVVSSSVAFTLTFAMNGFQWSIIS